MDRVIHTKNYFSKFLESNSFFWIIFISAWLNPILRLTENNPATVFRILTPVFLLAHAFIKGTNVRIFYLFSFFYIYNLVLCFLSDFSTTDSSIYLINYLFLFILFYFTNEFFQKHSFQFFYKMLLFFKFILFTVYILYLTQYILIKCQILQPDHNFYKSIIYTSVNDLALVICAILLLFLSSNKISTLEKLIHFLIIAFINIQNDSKAILIAQALIAAVHFSIFLIKNNRKFSLSICIFAAGCALFFLSKKQITMPDGKVSLNSMLAEPLLRIINLNPYKLTGSVYDRTDSTIYLIQSFANSKALGVGAGNSLKILSQPETSSLTALSAHNFLIEWLSEFGWLFLFAFVWFLKKLYHSIQNIHCPSSVDIISLAICIPFFSVAQSSGYISNYIFWLCLFYIYFKFKFYSSKENNYALSTN
jgi:hypothetical protein